MSDESKLKPCPFCGGEVEWCSSCDNGRGCARICCNDCRVEVVWNINNNEHDKVYNREQWEKRSSPPPPGSE